MRIMFDITSTLDGMERRAPASLPKRVVARLRATPLSLVIVAGIAALSHALWGMPYWWGEIRQNGLGPWLYAVALPDFVTAAILLVSIRASADSGTDLARRPGRFLLVLAIGALVAEAAMSTIYALFDVAGFSPPNRPLDSYLVAWLNSMLFGILFGWLGILHLQRREDEARFSAAMTTRSLLARRVTQSRLIAARAQIDPELVARILRNIRTRYTQDARAASALLDQMIAHLRLAMSRAREQSTTLAAELALSRSYLTLREAESGIQIAFHAELAGQTSSGEYATAIPIFPIVRRLCDEAVFACAGQTMSRIALHVANHQRGIAIELKLESAAIASSRLAQLQAFLAGLTLGDGDILQHFVEPGSNRYVVQAINR